VNTREWLAEHLDDLTVGVRALRDQESLLRSWGETLAERLSGGQRLLTAGNGGSAAEAQHLSAELVGRFLVERRPLSAICLNSETSSMTAILNDYGAEEVFARQAQAHGRAGDILMLLSTSGRSRNLLAATERAREQGLEIWAMTGPTPNPLAELSDQVFSVPVASTSAVQEVHLIAVHTVCAALDVFLTADPDAAGVRLAEGALATGRILA
jgi:phosphoheptose isomerase